MPEDTPLIWIVALGVHALASLAAFIAYGVDKRRAQRDKHRTRERTLHLWSLAGGWPGALAAQKLFRHKTQKRSFRIVFWLTLVLSVASWGVLIWWLG